MAAAILLALLSGGCVLPKYPGESARFLREIAAGQANPEQITPLPRAQAIRYRVHGGAQSADLYLPMDGPPQAAIVLVAGLAELGNRDPRLVQFARSLTRSHFAVLVPEIPNLQRLEIGPADAHRIGDAFRYLVSRRDLAPGGRAGIAAASYAVGPAVLAALEPDIRAQVQYVVGIAGHYDPEEVMVYAVTGHYRDRTQLNPPWQHRQPDNWSKWAFLARNFEYSPRAKDRELLRKIADRKRKNGDAPVADLAAQLGPQGRVYYDLLTAQRPERVLALIKQMPKEAQRQITAIDLSEQDLSQLEAKVILVHGRNDQLIPYTEAKALAAAAPRSRLYLVENFMHVDLGALSFWDKVQMMRAVSAVFDYREKRATDQAGPRRLRHVP